MKESNSRREFLSQSGKLMAAAALFGSMTPAAFSANLVGKTGDEKFRMANAKANKAAFRLLIEDAMPNGKFDVIRSLVSKECVTERAGFANLYNAIGDAIPERGNFLEWIEKGWKPLSEALNGQKVSIREVVGDGNTVMMMWDYEVQHIGTFAGAPATNKTLYWQEVGLAHFNDEGKIESMWFMCEELKLAVQLGYELKLK